jgi:two-component system osmolarity sensor histidine kinase EnvZ
MKRRRGVIKRFLPRSLLGRSLAIIVTPVVLLQLVSAGIFYESHWNKVSSRLARSLAGDIAAIVELLRQDPSEAGRARVAQLAATTMGLDVRFRPREILANSTELSTGGFIAESLVPSLTTVLNKPFFVDGESLDGYLIVNIQLPEGVLHVVANRKRLFSSTTYVFVMWMVGSAMILFGVAILFMRNQVRPIRRLAAAADNFGKGRDAPNFKPEGAAEVRRAATAFIAMRDRIRRQISQRTEMLAGVSHDLRTPLTRMKLQLAMLGDGKEVKDLTEDVTEMEHMLEGYLAFARGDGAEEPQPTDVVAILDDIAAQTRRRGAAIDLQAEGEMTVPLRRAAFKRCVTNLIENAGRFADNVSVHAGRRGNAIEITVDDDGPGIPEDMREEAFRPFFRLEASRNRGTGGVGLGLTIARDVVRSHGGDITLGESPSGGLRARLRVPI